MWRWRVSDSNHAQFTASSTDAVFNSVAVVIILRYPLNAANLGWNAGSAYVLNRVTQRNTGAKHDMSVDRLGTEHCEKKGDNGSAVLKISAYPWGEWKGPPTR